MPAENTLSSFRGGGNVGVHLFPFFGLKLRVKYTVTAIHSMCDLISWLMMNAKECMRIYEIDEVTIWLLFVIFALYSAVGFIIYDFTIQRTTLSHTFYGYSMFGSQSAIVRSSQLFVLEFKLKSEFFEHVSSSSVQCHFYHRHGMRATRKVSPRILLHGRMSTRLYQRISSAVSHITIRN